jgi:TRAP-type C4-dicarboxylate transport system permease small subunit
MTVFNAFTRALAWCAALLFVLAGVMLTYEVVARYFFTRPTIWAAELSQLCLIWGSLIAMAWVLGARRHIAVDAVVVLLPMRVRRITEALAMAAVAVFSAWVVAYGWDIFYDSFERGRNTGSMLEMPSWIPELSVPFGFAVLFVQAVIEFFKALRGDWADTQPGAHE